MGAYKLYRRHNCTRNHRSIETWAKCTWPRAEWITGAGRFAVLAHCSALTVTLWDTAEGAEAAKRQIDETGCGGRCGGQHQIVEIVLAP